MRRRRRYLLVGGGVHHHVLLLTVGRDYPSGQRTRFKEKRIQVDVHRIVCMVKMVDCSEMERPKGENVLLFLYFKTGSSLLDGRK